MLLKHQTSVEVAAVANRRSVAVVEGGGGARLGGKVGMAACRVTLLPNTDRVQSVLLRQRRIEWT
jgi:hypothetical protein